MNLSTISSRRLRALWFVGGLFICSVLAIQPRGTMAGDANLAQQRAEFLAAERAYAKGQGAEYARLKSRLTSYPLYPYLEYQELKKNIGNTDKQAVRSFIDSHPKSPLSDSLRRHWLTELGRRQAWRELIEFYAPDSSSERRCLYLQALLQTGRSEEALTQTEPVWLSGSSRPKACDPVFDAWRDNNRLSTQLVWQRIELAMAQRNTRLAAYLGRYLPIEEKPWLALWLDTQKNPTKILDTSAFAKQHPLREHILIFGLERLARNNPRRGAEAWQQLENHHTFTEPQRYQANRALLIALMRIDAPDLLDKLDAFTPDEDDEYFHEKRIREALARQAWPRMLAWIEALPPSLSERENWRYWRARALEQVGRIGASKLLYKELANERSYHGFLAADRIGSPYNLDHQPLAVPEPILRDVAARPGFKRAKELVVLGRLISARREWRNAIEELSIPELQAAARLAKTWGWHSQAIFTLAKTGYWDDLELRFPLEHQKNIEAAAGKQQLDKAWVLAVIRQESAFSPDAVSRAGARGLMQLMPATAKATAKAMKRHSPSRGDLLIPATNIDIGTAYLRMVYDKLNDNTVLAISAYNAGPHRVDRWLPRKNIGSRHLDRDHPLY